MRYGPHMGQRPSSMWQWPQLAKVRDKPGYVSCAFHQSELGASYPKPTRLLLKTKIQLPRFCYLGEPSFDSQAYYTGPLPWLRASYRALQNFRGVLATAHVPVDSFLGGGFLNTTTATTATEGVPRGVPDSEESYPVCAPEGGRLLGGHGPPRQCDRLEGVKAFHDGGGLCSPGRWPHDRRVLAEGDSWTELERVTTWRR